MDAIEWLDSGGWTGWMEDQATGEIVTAEGDTFPDAYSLKRYLADLPYWPRPRNGQRRIPKRREDVE